MAKSYIHPFAIALGCAALLSSCATTRHTAQGLSLSNPQHPIEIIYDNDVHCAMKGYAKFAFLRDSLRQTTPHVVTVSAGDFIQGDVAGAMSKGQWVVEVMNRIGYDFVVPGNHEFDFGGKSFFSLCDQLSATELGCNFLKVRNRKPVLSPYVIRTFGNRKVAFVGVLTTVSAALNSGSEFREADGSFIYTFDAANIFADVQESVNRARAEGAQTVVVVSHLGDTRRNDGNTSPNLIANTHGIDAVIDGHAHHVIPDKLVKNSHGKDVLLTSSGTKFKNVGRLIIDGNGHISSRLHPVKAISSERADIRLQTDSIQQLINDAGNAHVGHSDVDFPIKDEKTGEYIIRLQETNIGDLITDAFRQQTGADIGLMTAGCIRSDLKSGELKHMDIFSLMPFFNYLTISKMTGREICNALEFAFHQQAHSNTMFMEMSGLSCEIDTTVVTPCVMGSSGEYIGVGEGPRRVSNVRVLDGEGHWQPIDMDHSYQVAAIEYISVNHGCFNVLKDARVTNELLPNQLYAVDCVERYIQQALGGTIGAQYAHPQGRLRFK